MDQLRFDSGLGHYSVSAALDSVWIFKGMGTHYLQIQLQVGIQQVDAAAGRLLGLETTLYAPQGNGPRVPLASANVSVPFNSTGEVRQPILQYLITNAQLLALEQHRTGDLHLELQVRGFLPQASSGFPGAPEVTERISIAESRWRQQLAGLGRTLGAEMLIPFPDDDEPRRGSPISCATPSACLAATRSTRRCSKCARRWRPSRTPATGPGRQEGEGRVHCRRALGPDPRSDGGPSQRCHARGPRNQGLQVHASRGRDADRHDRSSAVHHALTDTGHSPTRPRHQVVCLQWSMIKPRVPDTPRSWCAETRFCWSGACTATVSGVSMKRPAPR